jgi:class 3 adenylate cyclase/alpha-beta hydrolase superfamily lysophospholipase
MEWGPVEYARAGDAHIAYRAVVGDPTSDHTIVMVNGYLYPLEMLGDDHIAARLVEGLAALGTLVIFDRRGIGLSDQIVDWGTDIVGQWADDLLAVVDAVGRDTVSVFSWHGFGTGRRFAARHAERVDRLILFNPFSPPAPEDREWIAAVRARIEQMLTGDTDGSSAVPSRQHDPNFREWQDRAGRLGASPTQAAKLHRAESSVPIPTDPGVAAPTLVIARATPELGIPRSFLERTASVIPGATLVTLADGDAFPIGSDVDAILAEVSLFLTGEVRLPTPEREVQVILFTDLVGSTRRAASDGDARWRTVLDHHDGVCHRAAARVGGSIVKSTGDGVLALFPSVSAAIGAARDIQRRLSEHDLSIRTGIHLGEVDHRGDDVSGVAINLAARVMAEAGAGEILLTDVAVSVGGIDAAEPIGTRAFKGFDAPRTIFRL